MAFSFRCHVCTTNNKGVGVADVVKALVHHVGIATVGVRVLAAATRKGHWEDPCTESAPVVQRYNNTGRSRCISLHYLYKVIGCFVPRSGSSFLVPDLRSSFRIFVPRSGSSFLVPDLRSSFRIFVPRSGSSFLVPDLRSSFRIFVPRSGSSFLVPDLRSSFRIFVPRSGCSFLVPDLRSSFRIFVPRSGSSFLVPDLRSSFRIFVPRSGYNPRFITISYR